MGRGRRGPSSSRARAARSTPGEVLASLAGRLAKYKIPKSLVLAPELPRTASGKLMKTRLRQA